MRRHLKRACVGILAAFCLAACARPLTENEVIVARTIFGERLDTAPVRISRGLGITPAPQGRITALAEATGTERACVRTPQPRDRVPPFAFAFRNRIHLRTPVYAADLALGWPRGLRWPQALLLAHEMTHVWQWQNRDETGYSALRAIGESVSVVDPYFAPPGTADFAAYGFEQQAALVEDFLCFTYANPDHPRRTELREILAPVIDVAAIEAAAGL